MAFGPEVGSVSVRVMPDTRGFKTNANRQLNSLKDDLKELKAKVVPDTDKFVAKLKADLKKNRNKVEYKVRVVADMDKFKLPKQMPKQAEPMKVSAVMDVDAAFQRKALSDLNKLADKFNQTIELTPDGEQIRHDLNKIFKNLEGRIRTPLPLDPKLASNARQAITAELQDLTRYATEGGNRRMIVPVDADTRYAIRRLRQLIDSMPDLAKRGIGQIKVDIDKNATQSELRSIIAELKAEAALASIEIDVDLNTPILRRASLAAGSLGRGFGWLATSIGAVGSAVGAVASGFGAMFKIGAKAGEAIAGVAGGLGTVLAKIPKTLLLAVPLVVGLIAAASLISPIIALISGALVAIPGLIAAIAAPVGVVALGMDGIKKAAEQAKPAFDELKKSVSAVFEQRMIPAFKTINDKLLPAMTNGTKAVAERLSDAFGAVVDTLSQDQQLNNIDKIFNNVAVGINKAIPGLKDFTAGILELVGQISEHFPDLGDWFSKVGSDFLNWVKEFTAADSSGVSDLDRTLQSLADTLSSIGGLGLDFIKQGLTDISNPQFGADMKGFVETVREWTTDILPRLTAVFQELVPWIERTAQAFDVLGLANRLGTDPFGTILDSVQGLAKGESLAEALGIDTLNMDAAKAGREAGNTLVTGVQSGAALGVTAAQSELAGAGKALTDSITQQVAAAGGDTGVASQIAEQIGGALAEAQAKVDAFGPQLAAGINAATQPLLTLGATISSSFTAMNGMILGMWASVVVTVTSGAQQVVAGITAGFAQLPLAVSGPVALMQQSAATGMQAVVATFTGVGSEVTRVVTTSFGQLPALIQTAMTEFNAALTAGGQTAVQTITGWGDQFVAAAMSIAGNMERSGASIGEAFARGIASRAGAVSAAAEQLAEAARSKFPNSPAKEGPFSGSGWVDKSGQAVGAAFAQGITDSSHLAGESAAQMAQSVLDNLNGNLTDGIKLDVKIDPAYLEELKKEKDALDLQVKAIGVLKDQAPDKMAKASLQAQLDQINARRREIGLIQEQAEYQKKYGEEVQSTQDKYATHINSAMKIPYDFAKTTANSFMSDLGISGNGAIPAIANWGMDLGSKFIFNVGGTDQAISMQQNIQRKEAAVRY